MLTHTKIICTIGPACNTVEQMLRLIDAGMNVARLNFSHGSHEEHRHVIDNLKKAREQAGKPLAIMLDTKGPEIRIGKIKGGQMAINAGQRLRLVKGALEGDASHVNIVPDYALKAFMPGMHILFDNGYIQSKVVSADDEGVVVEFFNPGVLSSSKGVNVPNKTIDLPAVTEKDIADIQFGCENDIDIIAASFIRSAEHVLVIKKLLAKMEKPEILVVAKIENHQGVENFDSIVQVADGIMVARGDLGVELPLSKVPHLQKMMIRKSYLAGKPVVTATQMLESMMSNPRPTRAEVSDVANAIYDSTSSVMLSGETAVGKYPVETVQVMRNIVEEAECNFNYREFFHQDSQRVYCDIPSSVTLATVKTAYSANAKAIFAFTSTGLTVRLLSRLRPQMPIIGFTSHAKRYHQMTSNWGVLPVLCPQFRSIDQAFDYAHKWALANKLVSFGDLVVVTAGSPFGVEGTTNMMIVENIGKVLVRGSSGFGKPVEGKVFIFVSNQSLPHAHVEDYIIVIPKADEAYLAVIQAAKGVILQNQPGDLESERFLLQAAKKYGLSVIVRADTAFQVLQEEKTVTIDPEKALVYYGSLST